MGDNRARFEIVLILVCVNNRVRSQIMNNRPRI